MDIDLTSLVVFCHLAECGNFSETGRRMKMSQPAVSVTISQLEGTVGLVLLERTSSGAKLTPAGVEFLARAEEVCEAYASFKDSLRSKARRMDREVWVGMDNSLFAKKLSEQISHDIFGEGVKCRCGPVGEDWSKDLEAGRVDVVIASRFLQADSNSGMQEAVIRQERGMTVAWHPSFHPFDSESFDFPEILRTTILVPDGKSAKGFGEFLEHWFEFAYGGQAANRVEFSSELEAARAADAGLGVFLGPGDAMERLEGLEHELSFVKTFEFLLPKACRFGVYCRGNERAKEVLHVAATICKHGRKVFKS